MGLPAPHPGLLFLRGKSNQKRAGETPGPLSGPPQAALALPERSLPPKAAMTRAWGVHLGGGFTNTLPNEELRCPVNKNILRGSDLVVWRLSDSARGPLKGTELAKGPSESLHGKSTPYRYATAGPPR